MSDITVLMTDMAILVGIFLLGLLAKLFPRTSHPDASHNRQPAEERRSRTAIRD